MTLRIDDHVSWRRLADRRDGLLSPRRAAAAGEHLAAPCALCAGEAGILERLVAAIRAGAPDAPPRRAEASAVRLYRETYLASSMDGRCVVGVLLLDRTDELAPALRAGPGETRRLLWRVGDYEVDASFVTRPGGIDVLAQIVPGGDDPDAVVAGEVVARTERGVRVRAPIEPDGRFTFRGLAPGLCTIEGRVDGISFVLPPLHVR